MDDLKQNAERWVRYAFADDIISSEQLGNDEDFISLCPIMEAGSWLLILEYYTGIKHINTNPKGTGNGQMVRISKFIDSFYEIIDEGKTIEEILNKLIAYSDMKRNNYSWYFRMRLDRIKYSNFVDIRKVFANLYSMYSSPEDAEGNSTDHGMMLQGILTANRRFREFMKDQKEDTEGEKQFFSL